MASSQRTIYVEDDIWKEFQKKCIDLNVSVSEKIMDLVKKEVEGDVREQE